MSGKERSYGETHTPLLCWETLLSSLSSFLFLFIIVVAILLRLLWCSIWHGVGHAVCTLCLVLKILFPKRFPRNIFSPLHVFIVFRYHVRNSMFRHFPAIASRGDDPYCVLLQGILCFCFEFQHINFSEFSYSSQ